jgi:hypothetical protein
MLFSIGRMVSVKRVGSTGVVSVTFIPSPKVRGVAPALELSGLFSQLRAAFAGSVGGR